MLSVNKNNFISSFLFWIPFIYFSYLITLAKIFDTMFNLIDKSGHSCPVTHLRGKVFSLLRLTYQL